MRQVLWLWCCCAFAFTEEPAPVAVSLRVADVPQAVREIGDTWLGAFIRSEAFAEERVGLRTWLARLEGDTGIALPTTPHALRSLRIDLGDGNDQICLGLWLERDAAPALANVDKTIAVQAAAGPQRGDLFVAATTADANGVFAVAAGKPPRIPVIRSAGVVRFAYEPWWLDAIGTPGDGWAIGTADNLLSLWRLPPPATPRVMPRPAQGVGIQAELSLTALLSDTGLPLAYAFAHATRLDRAHLTITAEGADLRETLVMRDADLPLRTASASGLAERVPRAARALTVIGLDGQRLGRLAEALAAVHPAAALDAETIAACRALDGTAWLAVTSDGPAPALVAGVPASPALDAWIARLAPKNPALLERAREHAVSLPPVRGLFPRLAVRRLTDTWLIATAPEALQHLGGSPAVAALAPLIDDQVVAAAWQDTAGLGADLATNVFARLWLGMQFDATVRNPDDTMVAIRRHLLLDQVKCALRWSQGLQRHGRPVSWRLRTNADGAVLEGRGASVALATFPLGLAWWWYGLPLMWPDEGVCSRFLSLARRSAYGAPVMARFIQDFSERLGTSSSIPQARDEAVVLLAYGSGASTRAAGIFSLSQILHRPEDRELLMALLLQATNDPCSSPRVAAWNRLGFFLAPDGAGPPTLIDAIARGLEHTDPLTRAAVAWTAGVHSHSLRAARLNQPEAWLAQQQQPRSPPPALLTILLTTMERETDPHARRALVNALSCYDDPRLPPLMRQWVADPVPGIRAIAAQTLLLTPGILQDGPTLDACLALVDDQTSAGWKRVCDEVCEALYLLDDPRVTAALARRFAYLHDHGELYTSYTTPLLQALSRRGHVPVIMELVRRIEQGQGFDLMMRSHYLSMIGSSPAPEGERELVRLLDQAMLDPQHLETAIRVLARRKNLQATSITALTRLLTTTRVELRSAARNALREYTDLDNTQRDALTQAERDARARFGADAFTTPEQRKQPVGEDAPPPPVNVNDF